MKKSKNVLSILFALCLLIVCSCGVVTSRAETISNDSASVAPLAAGNSNPVCTIYTSTSLEAGKDVQLTATNIYYNNVSLYNTAVVYKWSTNGYGTELALSPTNASGTYHLMGSTTYNDIAFPQFTNSQECEPTFKYGKNYNSSTGSYSDYTTIAWEHEVWEINDAGEEELQYVQVKYAHECNRIVAGKFEPVHYVGTAVPTDYDQNAFVWTHGLKTGKTIYGTVSYNGEINDIEVTVPWIGYKTTEVKLGGVTFSLRSGPSKVSIKASSAVSIDMFNFAYAI